VEDEILLCTEDVGRTFNLPTSVRDLFSAVLKKERRLFWVLRHISFQLKRGEIFGLIGESGCGKTTLAKVLVGLIPYIDTGKVLFSNNPKPVQSYSDTELRDFRKQVQMIFQNPDVSLNPRIKVASSLKEALEVNYKGDQRSKEELEEEIIRYLEMVCLNADDREKFPGELSGGEKRRLCIARAMAVKPDLVVADEPFTGLDISLRNQIVELMLAGHRRDLTTFFFISHDISTIGYLTSRMAVMYLGRIVEMGSSKELLTPAKTKHPYTHGLLAASQYLGSIAGQSDERVRKFLSFAPTEKEYLTTNHHTSCVFRERCYVYQELLSKAQKEICENQDPSLQVVDGDHQVACHHWS
jgi:oligopeptide/dipeptide ABC transporter ATP-binding protein